MAPNDSTSSNVSRGSASASAPTNAELMAMVSQLQEQLAQSRPSATVKPPKPDFFDGARTKLRGFLTQMDMQLRIINCVEEADKVIYASTYLRGQAFEWFEPYIREFNEKPMKDWGDVTKDIFDSYKVFKKKLETTFGDIDATRTAERRLRRLRQSGSASVYAAEFQQIISHLDWDVSDPRDFRPLAMLESNLRILQ